ncbi:hypothetical protein [Noviherbaspirillum autotrophicum]|uniref:Uncharacterized protein n=1 Tax=Noviherbaspirillum autotrophicum TaxID=709839 RepID=A0A0C2BZ62_9BURK|nr:hypothetical protein [Noviherbaspirillum autotrophicum]KIF83306.1 hypothetical protein TSA66_24690 [Noviherbaspirillum autotrophicum]
MVNILELAFTAFMLAQILQVVAAVREHRIAKAMPTLSEYIASHPQSQTERGIRCHHCKSGSIHVFHVSGIAIHRCNHCNNKLYRSN